jgi:hypothetical protein
MARGFHDLTPDEKSAFRVWEAKLADHTLSEAQHAECRRKMDELLWKGPTARVDELQAKVDRLQGMLIHALNENLRMVKALISSWDAKLSAVLGETPRTLDEIIPREPCPGLVGGGMFAVDPAPAHETLGPSEFMSEFSVVEPSNSGAGVHATTEKKSNRGRPKGSKNKPPVPSGEGAEQPAVTVAAGEVTAENSSFPEGATEPAARSAVDELFGIG